MRRSPVKAALYLALGLELALAVGLIAWSGWWAGVVLSLPMLLPLRGLLHARPRAAAWAAYEMIFYMAGLLAEAFALHERHAMGVALASVAALVFVSLILFIRWSAREPRLRTSPDRLARTESSGGGAC